MTLPNAQRGEVGFNADGKPYLLKFSTNAFCQLESITGASAVEVAGSMQGSLRFTTVRALFYVALQRHHKGLSVDDAGDLMDAVGIARTATLVSQAFALALPVESGRPLDPPIGATAGALS